MQELQSSSFWPLVEAAIQVHQRHRWYRNTPCVQAGIDRANQRAISNVATIKKWTLLTRSNNALQMRSYLMGPMYLSVENINVLSWTSSQMRNEKGLSMVAFCQTNFQNLFTQRVLSRWRGVGSKPKIEEVSRR